MKPKANYKANTGKKSWNDIIINDKVEATYKKDTR